MLEPVIVIAADKRSAYMQKQKPSPLTQEDIETLAMRLGLSPGGLASNVLDDIMLDSAGGRHPARRLTVTAGPEAMPEGATALDDAAPPDKPKKKRGPYKKKPK